MELLAMNAITSQAAIDLKVHMIIFIHQPQQIQPHAAVFWRNPLSPGVYSIDCCRIGVGIYLKWSRQS
jgi:hypothetical protein